MRNFFLFVSLLCLCLFTHCTKDVSTIPPKDIMVSQELKDWCLFKPGSYWIMRDSVTHSEDSVYVVSASSEMVEIPSKDKTLRSEKITVLFNSNSIYYGYILNAYRGNLATLTPSQNQLPLMNLDTLSLKSKLGDGILKNNSVSDFSLQGNYFGSVRYIFFSYLYSGPSSPQGLLQDYLFWKKNVGIIKKGNYPGYNNYSVKEVVRYHVIQ